MYRFTQYTGISYPATLFMHKNGVFKFYIDLQGFEEKLPKDLSVWIKNNEKEFFMIKRIMKNSLKQLNQIKNLKLTTGKRMLEAVRNATEAWSNAYIGVLVSHHLAMFHEKFIKDNGTRLYKNQIVSEAMRWRKAEGNIFFNEGVEVLNGLLERIVKIKKCDKDSLKHLTLRELENFIKTGKLPKNKLLQRRDSTYIYFKDKVVHRKDMKNCLNSLGFKLAKEEHLRNITKIKGAIASSGIANGRAKIIVNRAQLGKFNDGDIIVAHMTSPWYVQIMEKAAAIITDEGGITCHAAIISRELNKPCIIGTKYATQVLKDGDLVEVDANNGIVRKLK